MHLQDYLRNGGTLDSIERDFFIKTNRHGKYPNLVQFKYNQIESDFSIPLVCECRGVILDESNNWEVVARPFDKFFNYGEGKAAEIDWITARVQEKLDGSLCILYFYDNEWLVATSGMADASGNVNGFEFSFAELFWKTFKNMEYSLDPMYPNHTYMFELLTPYNRVVVQHIDCQLKLLAIRSKDGTELPIAGFGRYWKCVQSFPIFDIESALASFGEMNPLEQEGYVIVDGNFNRVKVKHPGYIALHHAKDSFGPREFVRVIRMGESEEFNIFLREFPEWKGYFDVIRGRFEALVTEIEQLYLAIKDIPVQKDFAAEATKYRMSGALFAIRNKKFASVREYLAAMSLDNLIEILDARNITLPNEKEETL